MVTEVCEAVEAELVAFPDTPVEVPFEVADEGGEPLPPLRAYISSLFPAPQYSKLFPGQVKLQSP